MVEHLDSAASWIGMPGQRRLPAWRPDAPASIDALQVVYKIAERCNINCTYCYYFNMGEESALSRPAQASLPVTDQLAHWIAQGCQELEIPHAKLSFHGGEPTLVGAEKFDEACQRLRDIVEPVATLALSIQTNGMLLDDDWVRVFIKHQVGVGVSIDGPKQANDKSRLDRRDRSTFSRTESGIQLLVDAHSGGGPLPSTISVLDSQNDYRQVYRYLRSLGIMEINFLLPDRNADDRRFLDSGEAARYGKCLFDIFSEWLSEDDPHVHIKFIDQMLSHFRPAVAPGQMFLRSRKSNQVVIARSDGTVAIDDSYIPALAWYADAPVYSTEQSTLREFLADPIFREIEETSNGLPSGCVGCRWSPVCRGGDFENRFSASNGFDNRSVYCDAYKVMYDAVCQELERNGYPADLIAEKFGAV